MSDIITFGKGLWGSPRGALYSTLSSLSRSYVKVDYFRVYNVVARDSFSVRAMVGRVDFEITRLHCR